MHWVKVEILTLKACKNKAIFFCVSIMSQYFDIRVLCMIIVIDDTNAAMYLAIFFWTFGKNNRSIFNWVLFPWIFSMLPNDLNLNSLSIFFLAYNLLRTRTKSKVSSAKKQEKWKIEQKNINSMFQLSSFNSITNFFHFPPIFQNMRGIGGKTSSSGWSQSYFSKSYTKHMKKKKEIPAAIHDYNIQNSPSMTMTIYLGFIWMSISPILGIFLVPSIFNSYGRLYFKFYSLGWF